MRLQLQDVYPPLLRFGLLRFHPRCTDVAHRLPFGHRYELQLIAVAAGRVPEAVGKESKKENMPRRRRKMKIEIAILNGYV